MDLVEGIYKITERFPKSEILNLSSQMKRCAVSIPSNIAEGRRWSSKKEFSRFLMIAYGSGAELETQLEIAKRLSFGRTKDYSEVERILTEVMKMLNRMIYKLKTNSA
jgi:four helix bundle protein